MADVCVQCEGAGLRIVEENGRQVARDCDCRIQRRTAQLLAKAQVPQRFRDCSLENYEVYRSLHASLRRALDVSKHFFAEYPLETAGKGLLFTGSSGLGKTHLAVSLLKALILERGASGVFWEQKQLLESLRATYEKNVAGAENKILSSVIKCDVLVLDDLGDMTPSDWSWDTTSYILNSRYNENRSTIITTNLDNGAAVAPLGDPNDMFARARQANTRKTLGDQVGERMRSRLQEMCIVVEMQGEDFRQKVKRANFAGTKRPEMVVPVPPGAGGNSPGPVTLVDLLLAGRPQNDPIAATRLGPEPEQQPIGANRMGKNRREPRDIKN